MTEDLCAHPVTAGEKSQDTAPPELSGQREPNGVGAPASERPADGCAPGGPTLRDWSAALNNIPICAAAISIPSSPFHACSKAKRPARYLCFPGARGGPGSSFGRPITTIVSLANPAARFACGDGFAPNRRRDVPLTRPAGFAPAFHLSIIISKSNGATLVATFQNPRLDDQCRPIVAVTTGCCMGCFAEGRPRRRRPCFSGARTARPAGHASSGSPQCPIPAAGVGSGSAVFLRTPPTRPTRLFSSDARFAHDDPFPIRRDGARARSAVKDDQMPSH